VDDRRVSRAAIHNARNATSEPRIVFDDEDAQSRGGAQFP
jgi:hypothetical protein